MKEIFKIIAIMAIVNGALGLLLGVIGLIKMSSTFYLVCFLMFIGGIFFRQFLDNNGQDHGPTGTDYTNDQLNRG